MQCLHTNLALCFPHNPIRYVHLSSAYKNNEEIRSTIDKKALVAAESGNSSTKLWPKSQHLAIRGSSGTAPKNGTRNCFARAAAPPVVAAKILDSPYLLVKPTQKNDT
jgi:hypothetical protein